MDLASLRTQQQLLAGHVIREDRVLKDPPVLIGGADVGFEQQGEITRAALVLLTWPDLTLVEYQVARISTTLPYIPGFLSFRECPALLAAWEKLSRQPDLLFVDGHGIAHPRRLGSPATLVCWWMFQPLVWRKSVYAAMQANWQLSLVHRRR